MQTNGVFTLHSYIIPVKKINEPIYVLPFGDIHRSAPLCDVDKWLEFLDWAKSKKNSYFLGMGDYDDLASTSERLLLTDRKLHESTRSTLEDLYRTNTDKLAKEVNFMRGKIIGLIEGNHYGEFQNGTTTTQRLAEKLDCKYLGVSTFIRLIFKYSTHSATIDIWAHHGKGAARLVGGSLNRVQQMGESAEADIYLMGHDHKKNVGMTSKLKLSRNGTALHHRKQLYARTGSFLKGYENNRASYIADSAMNPTDLGVIKIELTPRRDRKRGEDDFFIDIHASI